MKNTPVTEILIRAITCFSFSYFSDHQTDMPALLILLSGLQAFVAWLRGPSSWAKTATLLGVLEELAPINRTGHVLAFFKPLRG